MPNLDISQTAEEQLKRGKGVYLEICKLVDFDTKKTSKDFPKRHEEGGVKITITLEPVGLNVGAAFIYVVKGRSELKLHSDGRIFTRIDEEGLVDIQSISPETYDTVMTALQKCITDITEGRRTELESKTAGIRRALEGFLA